jgi:pathogenesis-related protein 1
MGLSVSLGIGLWAGFLPSLGVSHPPTHPRVWAQTISDPFATQRLVYVLSQDQWREATILSSTRQLVAGQLRWSYWVQFLDGAQEFKAHVPSDHIRTLTEAQAEGLTTQVYDLSSQTGIEEMMAIHNDLRRQKGLPPLAWSDDLAASAQAWAEYLLVNNLWGHSPASQRRRGTVGENLHQRQASPGMSYATPRQALAGWLNEQNFYDYSTNSCAPGRQCGHYLQMVWSDTREVGCAMARTADARREVWACQYYPGGIVPNQRPY